MSAQSLSVRAGLVLVTRPGQAGLALTNALRGRSVQAVHMPLIRFEPPTDPRALTEALAAAPAYDWIVFTSPRAVEAVAAHAPDGGWKSVNCAAVGPGTSRALAEAGVVAAVVAPEPSAHALRPSLVQSVANCVLFPLSQRASHSLADELREEGVDVRIVEAYRTLPRQPPGPELDAIAGGVAAVVLASPTAVEVYTRHVAPALVGPAPPLFVVIGDTTANAARAAGLGNVTVAEGTETSELVGAVLSSLASAVELST